MSKKTILCIEDEEDIRDLYRIVLTRAGYDYHYAAGGYQGLSMARELKPDLIILDLMMPDLNGIDVLHSLSEDTELQRIPVLIITVRDLEAEMLIHKLSEHANLVGYILKPFPLHHLIHEIERIFGMDMAVDKYATSTYNEDAKGVDGEE